MAKKADALLKIPSEVPSGKDVPFQDITVMSFAEAQALDDIKLGEHVLALGNEFVKRAGLKSWLQKSIRRGLEEDALYAAVELDLTGFPGAVWETLHHSASEDIGLADPVVCVVVGTLHGLWKHAHGVKETASEDGAAERLYLVHAVLACVHAKKSRLVDNALTVAYGDHSKREVPSWAHDKHTDQGKKLGHGFAHFFDEAALLADKDGSLHKPNAAYAEKARAICIAKEGQTR